MPDCPSLRQSPDGYRANRSPLRQVQRDPRARCALCRPCHERACIPYLISHHQVLRPPTQKPAVHRHKKLPALRGLSSQSLRTTSNCQSAWEERGSEKSRPERAILATPSIVLAYTHLTLPTSD